MRRTLTLLAYGLATFPFAAQAAVSDDLVFCSKLTNTRERIACYDAAARVAAKSSTAPNGAAQTQLAPSLVTAPAASVPVAAYSNMAQHGPFHGPYLAAGASYGLAAPHNYFIFDSISVLSGTARPSGASAVAAAGYNLQFGHFLAGLELSGRYGRERFSDSQVTSVNDPLGLVGQSSKSYHFNTDSSVHMALRAGLAVENTMIFAKVGFGAAHTAQSISAATVATICNSFSFSGGALICTRRIPFNSASSFSDSQWWPSLLFGAGVEQNFGSFFGRVEGQAEAVRSPIVLNEWLWTMRALGMVGFRF